MEIESIVVVTRGWWGRGRNEELLFNGSSFCLDDERILGMDSGDGCTTVCIYSILLNCTLASG